MDDHISEKWLISQNKLEKYQNHSTNVKMNINRNPGLCISLTTHRLLIQISSNQSQTITITQFQTNINAILENAQNPKDKKILKFVIDSRGQKPDNNPITAKFIETDQATKFHQTLEKLIQKIKNNPNYIQLARKHSIVIDSILNSTPYLREIHQQIQTRFKAKNLIKSVEEVDELVLADHPQIKKFLKMQNVQAYEVEKQVTILNLEDKIVEESNHKQIAFQGYSAKKELQGIKFVEEDKKPTINEMERIKKQDIFLSSIHQQLLNADLQMDIQMNYQEKYQPIKQQVLKTNKYTIPNKQYRIWQMKQIGVQNKYNFQQKKTKMSPESEKCLRQIIQLTKIMYKLMRQKQDEKVGLIKIMLTQLKQKNHQHSHVDQFLRKANQNYLNYNKGKFQL